MILIFHLESDIARLRKLYILRSMTALFTCCHGEATLVTDNNEVKGAKEITKNVGETLSKPIWQEQFVECNTWRQRGWNQMVEVLDGKAKDLSLCLRDSQKH